MLASFKGNLAGPKTTGPSYQMLGHELPLLEGTLLQRFKVALEAVLTRQFDVSPLVSQ
jgi:hypothetical protein